MIPIAWWRNERTALRDGGAKAMENLTLNLPMIDWITRTGWEINEWKELIEDRRSKEQTRDGYRGLANLDNSYFVGNGIQRRSRAELTLSHTMLQVSGAFADSQFSMLAGRKDAGECKTTRIDIQITTDWDRADLFSVCRRWRERGRKGNFLESGEDGEGQTVYLGAWGSDRFVRVYQKSKTICRFEVCYRKAHAEPMYNRLAELDSDSGRRDAMGSWLAYELLRIKDPVLDAVFGKVLKELGTKPPKVVRRPTSDTEKWFLRVVRPALQRYINSHDVDESVLDSIREVIGNVNSEL
jgi:hypothetical protein